MSDPLSYLPYAVASRGGRVDGYEAQQLVAAGLTLLQRSVPLVRALAGRRAAILLPTSPAFLTALAAAEGRGAVLINPLAAPAEIAYQLADAGVGAVFTNGALAARVPEDVTRVLLDDAPRAARVLHDGRSSDVDLGSHFGLEIEGDQDAPGARDEGAVVYTSAMAGRPLGAILTHRNLLANARSTVAAATQASDDHVLALLPWGHLFGLTVTATAPLLAGATVTTMDRFNPVRALELLASGGVTELVGVPAIFKGLLAAIERRGSRLETALRVVICGGAALETELQDRWYDATGTELRQGYGLTEAGPVCIFNRMDRPNARGTLGVAFPGVEVAIADVADERADAPPALLAAGGEGEIVVRGENVFAGYVSGGEHGLVRTTDGWLRTGDLGAMRDDGTVEFRGVRKPMFTRNGFNVYPREIEHVIAAMPGVQSVAVTPVADPVREHDIAVTVEGTVTADDVKRWCELRLSAYKQPGSVTVR